MKKGRKDTRKALEFVLINSKKIISVWLIIISYIYIKGERQTKEGNKQKIK